MYESLYHFAADPFRLSPDKRFSYQHPSYNKAMAYLRYAYSRAEGFVMITGSPGSGKTTLLDDLLVTIDNQHTVIARLVTTQLGASDLLRMVAYAFRLRVEGLDKATVIRHLEAFLVQQFHAHHRALLIIDEAQDLEDSAMEEMRLLTNLQMNNKPLLQVFLVGQENLLGLIQTTAMEQLHQRMIASSHLEPLSAQETAGYVLHRLRIAGWQHDPQLTLGALRRIHLFSGGIPRRINQLCSRLLLYGAMEEKHALTSKDVQEVIGELRLEHLVPAADVDPPAGLLDADDEIMAKGNVDHDESPASTVLPVAHRVDARVPRQSDTKSVMPFLAGVSPGRQGQALAEDLRRDVFNLAENEASAIAKPGSSPALTLVPGATPQPQALKAEGGVGKSMVPMDDKRWSLQSGDSKTGLIAIAAITVGMLLGVFIMTSPPSPPPRPAGVAVEVHRAPVHRNDLDALRERIAKGLAGEVSVTPGKAPTQLQLLMNSDMQFEVGDEAVSPALAATLVSLAAMLRDFPQAIIHVLGYCDVSGSPWRNEILSERRAQVVSNFLAKQGIAIDRLQAEGRSNSELRSQMDQGLNRRVEIAIEYSPLAATDSSDAILQPARAGDFHVDHVAGF